MKKQKIRIMVLLFLLFAVMLLILSFTNFNYSKKTLEEQMNMELEQLIFPGFRNGHESLPSRSFSYVILEIGENNEISRTLGFYFTVVGVWLDAESGCKEKRCF